MDEPFYGGWREAWDESKHRRERKGTNKGGRFAKGGGGGSSSDTPAPSGGGKRKRAFESGAPDEAKVRANLAKQYGVSDEAMSTEEGKKALREIQDVVAEQRKSGKGPDDWTPEQRARLISARSFLATGKRPSAEAVQKAIKTGKSGKGVTTWNDRRVKENDMDEATAIRDGVLHGVREAGDDHFYGSWSGGAKGSGGRPSGGGGSDNPALKGPGRSGMGTADAKFGGDYREQAIARATGLSPSQWNGLSPAQRASHIKSANDANYDPKGQAFFEHSPQGGLVRKKVAAAKPGDANVIAAADSLKVGEEVTLGAQMGGRNVYRGKVTKNERDYVHIDQGGASGEGALHKGKLYLVGPRTGSSYIAGGAPPSTRAWDPRDATGYKPKP